MKKYLEDAYCCAFKSNLIEIVPYAKNQMAILLDETYFYPEGGGQPSDIGEIQGISIIDVQIENDVIYHIIAPRDVATATKLSGEVSCKIDWQNRFALMQQHSGQHILSASAEKRFGANTVGFHIGKDYITIDLDQKLSAQNVSDMETLANQVLNQNVEIMAHYPDAEALSKMPLRKQPKVSENIRVIEVEGFDFSPCGGTHVKRTGEIGIIKVKKIENYKQGIRIEFVCGLFALSVFNARNDIINDLSTLLSVKENEIVDFVKQLIENSKQDKKELDDLKVELMTLEISDLVAMFDEVEGIKVIRLEEKDMSMNDLRTKVQLLCKNPNFIVLARSLENEKYHIVLSKSKEDASNLFNFEMNAFFKAYGQMIGLKGGGNTDMAQGGTTSDQDIDAFFESIEQDIQNHMSS
ncbi:DHHA1 domain-containing protein [Fusibacter sp. 3D3]|uniref:alanyl-tRNA editing protein n=1 Tax=Fusibacter sp. 3D3 TaxID=1048380 RepID=UPI000853B9F9|nr:DHHA1 domain-containing protein [Fusibacter sp. 3D3]GAU77449.1 alanyl-tRNA synthetase family protein [Fusibacter sp. 3D3]